MSIMPKVYDLTVDDVGYNGVTKRDIGKKMIVWDNGCVDIVKPYEPLTRNWIGHHIVENGGYYIDYGKDEGGNTVFICPTLPENVLELFPEVIVDDCRLYKHIWLVFPKNTRLTVKRTKWKGVEL